VCVAVVGFVWVLPRACEFCPGAACWGGDVVVAGWEESTEEAAEVVVVVFVSEVAAVVVMRFMICPAIWTRDCKNSGGGPFRVPCKTSGVTSMKNSTLELLKLDMLKGLSGRVVGVDVVGAVVVGGTLLVSLAPTVLLLLFWDLWVLCTTLTGLEVVLTSIGNDWSRIEAVGMKGNPLKLTVGWGPGGDACVVLVVSPEFGVDVAVAVVSVLVVAVVVVVDAFGRSADRLNWAFAV
jgi:hypothetical protein